MEDYPPHTYFQTDTPNSCSFFQFTKGYCGKRENDPIHTLAAPRYIRIVKDGGMALRTDVTDEVREMYRERERRKTV